ncbi:MAG: DUF4440 domain-containing protein [Gemmatimonadota bacterium]
MPPNVPGASGVAEIQESLGDFLGAVTVQDFKLTMTNLLVKGDVAIETGTSVMTFQPKAPGAPVVTENGKYVVVWKKQADGSWKLFRDIFNSSEVSAVSSRHCTRYRSRRSAAAVSNGTNPEN